MARSRPTSSTRSRSRRGAYVLSRLSLNGYGSNIPWAREAPEELLSKPAAIEAYAFDHADALISIEAPENTRELTGLPAERLALIQAGGGPPLARGFTPHPRRGGRQ